MQLTVIFSFLIFHVPSLGQLLMAEERSVEYLLATTIDTIHHTSLEVWRIDIMRQSYRGSAAYEIGFLVRTTEERYRKMVDLYNTSVTLDDMLRTRDHIMYLQKIEKLHWDVAHLANMLHEVERKYKIERVYYCGGLDSSVQKIMSELSWSTRTKFLEYVNDIQNKPNISSLLRMRHVRRVRSVGNDFHVRMWNVTQSNDDEEVMKMKLYRLMYETVKDSDLKIKRAELVKSDYENATGFDLGYVIGDVTDKLNVMEDISRTLKRLYDTWRPVEHVNAYEQIANLAIEVTHLVDMVRVMTTTRGARK